MEIFAGRKNTGLARAWTALYFGVAIAHLLSSPAFAVRTSLCKRRLGEYSVTKIVKQDPPTFLVGVKSTKKDTQPRLGIQVEIHNPDLTPFEVPIFSDSLEEHPIRERILFDLKRLVSKHRRVRVKIQYLEEKFVEEPLPGDCLSGDAPCAPLVLEFHGKFLHENLDTALVGINSMRFFPELRDYFTEAAPNLVVLWENWIRSLVAKASAVGFKDDEKETLEQRIRRIIDLRNVWRTKMDFCELVKPPPAHPDEVTLDSFVVPLHDVNSRKQEKLFAVTEAFAAFHGFDLGLVRLLWDEQNPDGWDFPIASAPYIPMPSAN